MPPIDVRSIAIGEIPISSKASSTKTWQFRLRGRLRALADEYLLSGPNCLVQRLLFAIASYCAPTNIAPKKSLWPSYAIDSRVCSFTRVNNVGAKRGNR